MGRLDDFVNHSRAVIDRWLPWYDERAAARESSYTHQVVENANAIIENRSVRRTHLRSSYQRADDRLARR